MLSNTLNDKIGNSLIYISQKLGGSIYLTKVIKLLYIADETSIHETGVPFTWLDYKAWRNGPVPEELHTELRYRMNNQPYSSPFSKFINVKKVENPVAPDMDSFLISAAKDFNDDDFSDYDINLLDRIIEKYGKLSGNELINILHQEGTLWHKVVKDNQLELSFKLRNNKSDCLIPFTQLLKDNEIKQLAYKAAYSSLLLAEKLNEND